MTTTSLHLGEFLVQAFQIEGVDPILKKKVMPLLFSFFKEHHKEVESPRGITRIEAWQKDTVTLKHVLPEDSEYSLSSIEDMTNSELIFQVVHCFEGDTRKSLLEEIILVFQSIILHGVKL